MHDEAVTPAHFYQEYFGPAVMEPLAKEIVAIAPPRPGDRVLDLACGTGIVARHVAPLLGSDGAVVAVDVNPAMLDVARSNADADGAPIEYRLGDGTALDLPDGDLDVLYCQQGLQFFPDRAAGAAEMRRVLRQGGRATVTVWKGVDSHPAFSKLTDAEEKHLALAGVPVSREELEIPFSFGDAGELSRLFTAAGFSNVELVERTIEARFADADHFMDRMEPAYGAIVPQLMDDPDAFQRFVAGVKADAQELVDAHRDGDDVVFPMHANILLAS